MQSRAHLKRKSWHWECFAYENHVFISQNVKLDSFCISWCCDESSHNTQQNALWNHNWNDVLCPQLVKHMGVWLQHLDPAGKHMRTHLALCECKQINGIHKNFYYCSHISFLLSWQSAQKLCERLWSSHIHLFNAPSDSMNSSQPKRKGAKDSS